MANGAATVSLPLPMVRQLQKKVAELDNLLESIAIISDNQLMEGIRRAESHVKSGRVRRIRNVGELDSLR